MRVFSLLRGEAFPKVTESYGKSAPLFIVGKDEYDNSLNQLFIRTVFCSSTKAALLRSRRRPAGEPTSHDSGNRFPMTSAPTNHLQFSLGFSFHCRCRLCIHRPPCYRNGGRNTIEGFWSIVKRGIIGTFHKVSAKYLPLYVNEFEFRYNNRNNADIFGAAIKGY